MALRARLVAPPIAPRLVWPWHHLSHGVLRASQLALGDRRMEAAQYLSTGFDVRGSIEGRLTAWTRFDKLASVVMPGRLKAIHVDREHGTPFLAATQVYDVRPTPRKWLALSRTEGADSRFVKRGTILVTRSGSVGKTILSYAAHDNILISDDLLRVEPFHDRDKGWIYGYLHAPQVQAMMTSAQYGHIIKHLETTHLEALPIPSVDDETAERFNLLMRRILLLRNESHRLSNEAEARFAAAIGPVRTARSEFGFEIRARETFSGRRRLEASYHVPQAMAIVKRFKSVERLRDVADRVWWMPRFKRFYGEGGLPYLSADELFTVNPAANKLILVDPDDGHEQYFVRAGWIVMACSGQVYGLNGAAALVTEHHESVFFSHDLIRIVANPERIRAGYLLVALTHPIYGRPLLIRAAYGTSIPHLDPNDVAEFPVVRLGEETEIAIDKLATAAARARAEADALERQLARDAGDVIEPSVPMLARSAVRRVAERLRRKP